jgi:hypothetical protein
METMRSFAVISVKLSYTKSALNFSIIDASQAIITALIIITIITKIICNVVTIVTSKQ